MSLIILLTFFMVVLAVTLSWLYFVMPEWTETALLLIFAGVACGAISVWCLVTGEALPLIALLIGRSLWGIMVGTLDLNS